MGGQKVGWLQSIFQTMVGNFNFTMERWKLSFGNFLDLV